jgi:hypothetical protein
MLRAELGKRTAPLYVWLVSAGKNEGPPTKQYPFLPREHHTLIDILALNEAVKKSGTDIPLYVFWIISQKTDFVNKVITQLNVSDSMTALQKARQQDAIVVTASHAHCDGRKISASFKQAVASSGKKRAAVIKTSETEQRRAWWNMAGFF